MIVEALDDGTALVRIPGNDGLLVVKGEGPVDSDNGLIVWDAPDAVNWQQQLEVLHASGGCVPPRSLPRRSAAQSTDDGAERAPRRRGPPHVARAGARL